MKNRQHRRPLALTIEQDMAARLQAGELDAAELTLAALSARYGVSVTPVREAIASLLERGQIVRQENGRLKPGSVSTPTESVNSESAYEMAAIAPEDALLREILKKSLAQSSEYVREDASAQLLGVSRTTVRQLFSKYAGQGMLTHVPRCGWRVRPLDRADMHQYLAAREVIELAALDAAIPHLEKSILLQMYHANRHREGKTDGEPILDNRLHAYLLEKSGNRYYSAFFETFGTHYTLLFDLAAPQAHVMTQMAEQHREILSALLDERWEDARLGLRNHIRAQASVVSACMEAATLG